MLNVKAWASGSVLTMVMALAVSSFVLSDTSDAIGTVLFTIETLTVTEAEQCARVGLSSQTL